MYLSNIGGVFMIEQQQKLMLSPYMEIYELVIPKDNLLRQIKELVDFSFIYDELLANYCLDNGRNAVPPIRMFKYLLLKSIYDLSGNRGRNPQHGATNPKQRCAARQKNRTGKYQRAALPAQTNARGSLPYAHGQAERNRASSSSHLVTNH